MCQGKFPKLRGTVYNTPFESPNMCKVLERGKDSNDVINVELI